VANPTYVGSNGNTGSTGTTSVTFPVGTAAGHFALLACDTGAGTATLSGPPTNGWTEIANSDAQSNHKIAIWYKTLDSTDISTGSVSVTRSVSALQSLGIIVFSGAKYDGISSVGNSASSASVVIPTITPTAADCIRVGIMGVRPATANVTVNETTPPSGWTARVHSIDSGSGNRRLTQIDTIALTGQAGVSQGTATSTIDQTSSYGAYSVTIAPAASQAMPGPITGAVTMPAVTSTSSTVRKWDGVGLADGVTVTTSTVGTADNAFSTVTGTVTTALSGNHPARLRFDQQAAAQCLVQWGSLSGLNLTQTAGRFYWTTPSTMPASEQTILSADGVSSTVAWSLRVAGTGSSSRLRLRDKSNVQVGETSAGFSPNTTYRIEWLQTEDQMTVNFYVGDSSTYVESLVYNNTGSFNVVLQLLAFGYRTTSVQIGTSYFDDILLSSNPSTLIGPTPGSLVLVSPVTGATSMPSVAVGGVLASPAQINGVTTMPAATVQNAWSGFNDFDSVDRTVFDNIVNGGIEASGFGFSGNGLGVRPSNAATRQRWTTTTFGTNKAYGSVAFRMRFPGSLPQSANLGGTDAAIMTTKSTTTAPGTGQGHFGMFFHPATNKLRWDLLAADFGESTMTFVPDQWYYVEAKWYYGSYQGAGAATYTADVRINGIPQASISSSGLDPYFVQGFGFGSDQTNQTYSVDIDDVKGAAGTQPLAFLGNGSLPSPASITGVAAIPSVIAYSNSNANIILDPILGLVSLPDIYKDPDPAFPFAGIIVGTSAFPPLLVTNATDPAPRFFFTTPSYRQRPYIRHGLFGRTYLDVGYTILRFGESYQQFIDPDPEQVESADAAFPGGRIYEITEDEADRLIEAGYGAWVSGS
jgi:hypothetical protein